MKRKISALLLLLMLALHSCRTVEQVSIDRLLPAEVYYPEGLRSVAIVNHPSDTADTTYVVLDSMARSVGLTWLPGNTAVAAESLAKSLAEANYFDEVVICDSVVHASGDNDGKLTQAQVARLVKELNVDFLITVDDVSLLSQRTAQQFPELDCYRGVNDVKIYSTVQAYVPQRGKPLFTVYSNDSIFWEEYGSGIQYVANRLPADSVVVREASDFAGTLPLKFLAPHWETVTRQLYSGRSVAQRDAMVCVKQGDWDGACKLWSADYEKAKKSNAKKSYSKKSGEKNNANNNDAKGNADNGEASKNKTRMVMAYNLAVYNEVAGDIDTGLKFVEEARKIAYNVDNVEKKEQTPDSAYLMPYFTQISAYAAILQARKDQLMKLEVQMKRFSDDF